MNAVGEQCVGKPPALFDERALCNGRVLLYYTLCIAILRSYPSAIFHENVDIDLHHFMDPDEAEECKTESD